MLLLPSSGGLSRDGPLLVLLFNRVDRTSGVGDLIALTRIVVQGKAGNEEVRGLMLRGHG